MRTDKLEASVSEGAPDWQGRAAALGKGDLGWLIGAKKGLVAARPPTLVVYFGFLVELIGVEPTTS